MDVLQAASIALLAFAVGAKAGSGDSSDRLVRGTVTGLILFALLLNYAQVGMYGSPAQVTIMILLSIVTLGGTVSVKVILGKLSFLGEEVGQIKIAVTRLEGSSKDALRRIEVIENAKRERDERCGRHESDIEVLKDRMDRME